MNVYLTIVRYPKWLAWAGFLSMALFRLPLMLNKKISFSKLMGSGKNGTFDKVPDLRQWAILAVASEKKTQNNFINSNDVFGKFIHSWWSFFNVEKWELILEPTEGHGTWDRKKPFGNLSKSSEYDGLTAVLTRATIRLNRLSNFWKNVDSVAIKMSSSKGFITSVGIGEIPWIKQATFSIWASKEDMRAFAYKMHEHAEVIRKTRQEKWYSEDMFVRFKIISSKGTLQGTNPLAGIL